jgi:hypothetical protein
MNPPAFHPPTCVSSAEPRTRIVRTDVPEKLLALVRDIEAQGSANLTRLAADFCQHCDSRYGHSLAGPSRT